ncbi:MAG TPA: LptA/OstA family protein [Candidatus Acidoferrum sp.]|jgi:lipopolysaccharide export system protein LptA|nr:LptA/OstA family protein [Candidatus Acidoferrum sp.]
MNRRAAARYARWSALLAFALAGITGGLYVQRLWVAHREKQNAPAPLPQNEEKQFTTLHFKKVEGDRTIFDLEASKSTDLRGQDISLLEDVKIKVFGKNGDRNDVIHTQSCRYAKTDGSIQCDGKVQFELQSAEDLARTAANPAGKPDIIHIDTSGVTFERATGGAQTVQPVKFSFPNGSGDGVGAVYQSEQGQLRLIRDVHIQMQPAPDATAKKGTTLPAQVEMSGSSMEIDKVGHIVQLFGPATATSSGQQVTAGQFMLLLDGEFRAQALVAAPGSLNQQPEVKNHGAKGDSTLRADKLTAHLSPQGWTSRILAEGKVQGTSPSGNLEAESGEMEMWPGLNQAKLLTLRGNVRVNGRDLKSGMTRSLTSNVVQLTFAGGKAGAVNRVQHAETLERGVMEWLDAAAVSSKLAADKLALDFSARGKPQLLNATGAVQSQREIPGRPVETASSATGVAQLSAAGDWSQITLRGNVRLQEAERNAEAQQAVFARAAQTTVLTGQAMVRDAGSETHAPKITFFQSTGEIETEGPVRSTDFDSKSSTLQMSSVPANLSADHMRANSKTGRAVYTGHARLWQGASVLEADTIELLRPSRILNASGNVRAVFPQAPPPGASAGSAPVWHISSGLLTYWDAENRAHLEKDVFVQSADQKMRAPQLELFFTRTGADKQGSGGTSQISRAVGTGGVVVEQGGRRGTAERGLYTAAEEKFVLTGGTPTLFDPVEGTTTGRELTFYRADDTIVVDSGNGLRTLTKHRVQR